MNLTEKLKEIKRIIFNEETVEEQPVEITFIDARTVDGRIMRVEELQEGQKVQEVTEDGVVDVEPGTYELEGGVVVVVGEDSVIAEVRLVEEEVVEMSEETEQTEEVIEMSEETEEVIEEEVVEVNFNSEIIEMLEKLTNDFNDYKEKVETELNTVKEDFSKFKNEPSAEKTDIKKIDFNKTQDTFEKLKYFSKRNNK